MNGNGPPLEKKKIIPGPPKAKATAGATGAMGSRAGHGGSGSSSHKSANSGYRKVHDEDDDEATFDGNLKKKPRDAGGSPSGFGAGSAKNGLRKEGSSFKIPKRESGSPRPLPPSGSSGALHSKSSGGHGSGSNSSNLRKTGRADGSFEPKPSKDPTKRRPDGSKRADSGDRGFQKADAAARTSEQRKRQMEERLREEERKKKRPKIPSGQGATTAKPKVKAEPVRRMSSSAGGKARTAAAGKAKAKPREVEKKFKEKNRKDRIEEAMKVYKWWEEPSLEHGKQWESLEHNGAHFATEYQPHGVKLKYDGEDVHLTPQQEEIATFYASVSTCSFCI